MQLNKVMLAGNISNDLELTYSTNGTAILNFSLACNETYTQNGEKKQSVYFANIRLFGKRAENVARYCQKGSELFVEGKMARDSWEDRSTGKKIYKDYVKTENVQFIGKKGFENTTPTENTNESVQEPKNDNTGDLKEEYEQTETPNEREFF